MPAKEKPPGKKRRGPKGKGTVFLRGGVWVARKPAGKLPSGKTRYLERRGRTQAEALRRLAEAGPPGPQTTVSEWAAKWMAASDLRPGTAADYAHTVERYVGPTLGHLKIREVTAHQVEAALRTWAKTLGPNTVRKNLGHLVTLFEAARRAKLVAENPAADARRPKPKTVEIDPFTPAELSRIVAGATSTGSRIFALLATAGCRIGEALALDVPDFDPAAGTVSISRTYSRKHGMGPPKSARGVRVIRVPADAAPALAAAAAARKAGALFPTPAGGRRQHSTVQRGWRAFLARLGLRYRNPHQTRHSVATALLAAGVPLPDVAAYLGDTPETILRTYCHPTGADPAAAMERLLRAARQGGDKVG